MQAPPSPHTPDNWDAASRAYAEVVSTRLMEALAQIIDERFGSGPIRFTNTATIGYGVAG